MGFASFVKTTCRVTGIGYMSAIESIFRPRSLCFPDRSALQTQELARYVSRFLANKLTDSQVQFRTMGARRVMVFAAICYIPI